MPQRDQHLDPRPALNADGVVGEAEQRVGENRDQVVAVLVGVKGRGDGPVPVPAGGDADAVAASDLVGEEHGGVPAVGLGHVEREEPACLAGGQSLVGADARGRDQRRVHLRGFPVRVLDELQQGAVIRLDGPGGQAPPPGGHGRPVGNQAVYLGPPGVQGAAGPQPGAGGHVVRHQPQARAGLRVSGAGEGRPRPGAAAGPRVACAAAAPAPDRRACRAKRGQAGACQRRAGGAVGPGQDGGDDALVVSGDGDLDVPRRAGDDQEAAVLGVQVGLARRGGGAGEQVPEVGQVRLRVLARLSAAAEGERPCWVAISSAPDSSS